jgi:DNA-binding GntR family transcriptional regulator
MRIAEDLRKQIAAEALGPSDIVTVAGTAQHWSVAKSTAGKAMRMLEREGPPERALGIGYMVRNKGRCQVCGYMCGSLGHKTQC